MPYLYPEKISPSTKFSLYAGLPLTRTGDECLAWDRHDGRPFDLELFDTHAKACSEAEFRKAVNDWEILERRAKAGKSIPIVLPRTFPEGTKFADEEDIPLALSNDQCTAWDRPGGRWYNSEVFWGRSYKCSEAEFRKLVDRENVERLADK
jgi:hypothetical protein